MVFIANTLHITVATLSGIPWEVSISALFYWEFMFRATGNLFFSHNIIFSQNEIMRILIVIFTGNLPVLPSTIHFGVDIFTPRIYFKYLRCNVSMIFKFAKPPASQP